MRPGGRHPANGYAANAEHPAVSAKFSRRRRSAPPDARSVLLTQIAAALAKLKGRAVSDSDIHAARKSIKKARATLRLMRAALPDGAFRNANHALRDASGPLNASRDAKILLDALDRLVDRGDAVEATPIAAFRRVLVSAQRHARREAMTARTGIPLSRRILRATHRNATRWPAGTGEWPALREGLQRTYARGRRALAAADARRSAGPLHEWRKQGKYLWHQLQFLQPMGRGAIGKLADRAHRLSDYLGQDHDLAVLREQVLANKAAFQKGKRPRALLVAIDRCRDALQARAFALGARLYDDEPSRFAGRFDRYWRD